MRTSREHPVAVRAVASLRSSRLNRRPVRVCRYDALWADGRVDFDVNLVRLMYRGHPADFEPIDRAVHQACPEVGVGRWVDDRGAVVDGPDPDQPDWLPDGVGRAMPYRPERYAYRSFSSGILRSPTDYAWRIGPGLVGLIIGVLLLARSGGASAVGFLGAICVLLGVASLVSLLVSLRRR